MLEILAIQAKAKTPAACTRCNDPAINHCASCEMFMRKNCSELHNNWPIIKSRNVSSVEELSNPESQAQMRKTFLCNKLTPGLRSCIALVQHN